MLTDRLSRDVRVHPPPVGMKFGPPLLVHGCVGAAVRTAAQVEDVAGSHSPVTVLGGAFSR